MRRRNAPQSNHSARKRLVRLPKFSLRIFAMQSGGAGVASFPLMANREDQHYILSFFVAVKRHIAAVSTRNHQLSKPRFHLATDKRVIAENQHRFRDQVKRGKGCVRVDICKKVCNALDVVLRPLRVYQPRQDLAFGLAAFLPCIRART